MFVPQSGLSQLFQLFLNNVNSHVSIKRPETVFPVKVVFDSLPLKAKWYFAIVLPHSVVS